MMKNNNPDLMSHRERANRLKNKMNKEPSKLFIPFNLMPKIKLDKNAIIR